MTDSSARPATEAGNGSCDEESPLLAPPTLDSKVTPLVGVGTIIAVLLLGEFISNADSTLVIAASGHISSEFDRLRDASWLSTGYSLGLCAAQPMYGKLSDIYGRKPLLLLSYFLFALGCIISGVASHMGVVILGRAISGIGGAGTMTISSVIITDIVPRREIATWRAYVNIAMTLGRSLGGPVGGWLSDTVGWRWLFLLQAPVFALAAFLVIIKLQLTETVSESGKSKLGQVDFLGTGLLGAGIVALIGLLDQGGKAFPWTSWLTFVLGGCGLLLLVSFVLVEAYVAKEPIFNLRILRRPNVAVSYVLSTLQITAQLGMLFSVPLYFQVTQNASTTAAGVHLVPAVVGNTVGGLFAGIFIRKTGSYRVLLVLAGLVASVSYILLGLRWNGNTGPWESLYILPGGMGTGMASAAAFVALTAALPPNEVAMATAMYMLLISFAMTAGVTTSNSVLGMEFKRQLELHLHGPGSERVIQRAMDDTDYIAHLSGRLREIVVACYIAGLKHTYVFSLVCSLGAAFLGLFIRHQQL
ncbi:Major facilitator superfamily domain general substrate transporter [Penicillium odoratum]|uniref:Major facilitator superfamily domain general substrate transporter n=1 Tax=Penicillium odoratum TaxID=1167516 RepID=UPI002546DB25|nr:Major facilitator superfamily domain general substrate transporter [Penicillium odoratum]KAJ5768778.1 Major facilitator superfamily domain general substrate transporter [Penicillium odoratum]